MEEIWALLSGVVLFLFGMTLMGEHLRRLSGGRAERLVRRAADDRRTGALLGLAVTAAVFAGIIVLNRFTPAVI